MCGLTSGDAHSNSGEALYQCIYEVFDVLNNNSNIRVEKNYNRMEVELISRM